MTEIEIEASSPEEAMQKLQQLQATGAVSGKKIPAAPQPSKELLEFIHKIDKSLQSPREKGKFFTDTQLAFANLDFRDVRDFKFMVSELEEMLYLDLDPQNMSNEDMLVIHNTKGWARAQISKARNALERYLAYAQIVGTLEELHRSATTSEGTLGSRTARFVKKIPPFRWL